MRKPGMLWVGQVWAQSKNLDRVNLNISQHTLNNENVKVWVTDHVDEDRENEKWPCWWGPWEWKWPCWWWCWWWEVSWQCWWWWWGVRWQWWWWWGVGWQCWWWWGGGGGRYERNDKFWVWEGICDLPRLLPFCNLSPPIPSHHSHHSHHGDDEEDCYGDRDLETVEKIFVFLQMFVKQAHPSITTTRRLRRTLRAKKVLLTGWTRSLKPPFLDI